MKQNRLSPDVIPETLKPFVEGLRDQDEFPRKMARLCEAVDGKLPDTEFENFVTAVRQLDLNDPVVLGITGKILGTAVPGWHFACLDDLARNNAFKNALNASVTAETLVLDIGAGCGILSLLAAQAGAKHVYAVEISNLVANAARKIVALNGFSDRITIIEKDILDVKIGRDIPQKCNLVVQDVIWPQPFSKGLDKFLDYAKNHLITDDSLYLPKRISKQAMLIGPDDNLGAASYIDTLGFDLSPMDIFAPYCTTYPAHATPQYPMSEPVKIVEYEMDNLKDVSATSVSEKSIITTNNGPIVYLLEWLNIEFPGGVSLDNGPLNGNRSCRVISATKLADPIETKSGDAVKLIVENEKAITTIRFDRPFAAR